jgi:hypothetical protein
MIVKVQANVGRLSQDWLQVNRRDKEQEEEEGEQEGTEPLVPLGTVQKECKTFSLKLNQDAMPLHPYKGS